MNRFYIATVLAVLLPATSYAQTGQDNLQDGYGVISHTEGWARRFAHKLFDNLMGAEYYDTRPAGDRDVKDDEDADEVTKVSVNVNIGGYDDDEFDSYPYFVPGDKTLHFGPGHTPGFYIGINNLCGDQPPGPLEELPQRAGKGFEFGFALSRLGYHMTPNLSLNTAVYISRSRYWFSEARYLDWTDTGNRSRTLQLTDARFKEMNVTQGYMRYWSLRIPFCFELKSANYNGPYLAVGPEIEYRFGEASKVKTEGSKKKKTVTNDLNLNPLSLNLVARIGISDFGIIARYSFSELFKNDNPAKTAPFMIGVTSAF